MILIILKSALAMAVFLLLYRLFLEKESLYRFNRFFLLTSLVISLVLPFVVLPSFFAKIQESPKVILEQLIPDETTFETQKIGNGMIEEIPQTEISPRNIEVANQRNWVLVMWIVYFLGFALFFSRFVIQLIQFRKLILANPVLQKDGYKVVLLSQKNLPFTFLSYLFVSGEDYHANKIEPEIWEHELTHIRQKHSLDLLFAEVLKVLLWFNPLLLFYKKAIQINHEYLADEAVNNQFQNKTAYQMLLFSKVSQSQLNLSLSSPFNFSVTKKRLIMMGRFTSPVKSMMVKWLTFLIVLAVFFSLAPSGITTANPISLSLLKSSVEEYEKIINEAFDEEKKFVLVISNLDLPMLKQAYDQLHEEEKENVTEFPFFDEAAFSRLQALQKISDKVQVTMQYNAPPPTKQVKAEIWENWKKTKNLELEIDGKMQDVSVLESYSPEDFALFEVRETEPKRFLKKPSFIVKLTTPEEYHRKYLTSKKEIQIIIAEFENGDRAEAYYFMKYLNKFANHANPDVEPFVPENFEASVLDSFLNFSPDSYRNSNMILKVDLEIEIPLSLVTNGERKYVFVPIIEERSKKSDNRSGTKVIGWLN